MKQVNLSTQILNQDSMDIKEQRNELIKEIQTYADVSALLTHPGWQVIDKYFRDSISILKDQILVEKDYQELIRLQERFKAYSAIPNLIQTLANLREQKSSILKEFDELHNFNNDYGLS